MRIFPLGALILTLSLTPAWSQQLGQDDEDLGTTVITASRVPVAGAMVGSSFTVIDRAEIEQRQVAFVSDLLRDVPGLAVSRSGGMGQFTDVRTRGAEANHTLVLINGVKANDPAFSHRDDGHLAIKNRGFSRRRAAIEMPFPCIPAASRLA